jgi:hypothetical protein
MSQVKTTGVGQVQCDLWELSADREQKHQMLLAVEEYRRYLNPLVMAINAQWCNIANLTATARLNAVEKMIH